VIELHRYLYALLSRHEQKERPVGAQPLEKFGQVLRRCPPGRTGPRRGIGIGASVEKLR
jgi:hypothetical protein